MFHYNHATFFLLIYLFSIYFFTILHLPTKYGIRVNIFVFTFYHTGVSFVITQGM